MRYIELTERELDMVIESLWTTYCEHGEWGRSEEEAEYEKLHLKVSKQKKELVKCE